MGLEKTFQHEVTRSLSLLGWSQKLETDTQVCPMCHHKINPRHKGLSDFQFDMRREEGLPLSFKVEAKDGDLRFKPEDISDDQLRFIADWEIQTNGKALIWIVMGTHKAGSKHPFARRVWLIPFDVFMATVYRVERETGRRYLPLNIEAANAENMRTKSDEYTIEKLFADYVMDWQGYGTWRPNPTHPIWSYVNGH
jgi:hypothetical protein